MSQIYLSSIVSILAVVLPALGIEVGSEELTTTLQTLVLLASSLWIIVRRVQQGDIGLSGVRK